MSLKTDQQKKISIFGVICIGNITLFALIYTFKPEMRNMFYAEDHFIENLTTLFLLMAAIIGFLFCQMYHNNSKAYLTVPVLSLLAFLDEISFGERLFNFQTPNVGDTKLDSIHDIVEILINFLQEKGYLHFFGIMAISLAIFGIFFLFKRRKNIIRTLNAYPFSRFLTIAFVFLFISQIFDNLAEGHQWFTSVEEVLELNAALALMFSSREMKPYIKS